jgi:hypothetical protein
VEASKMSTIGEWVQIISLVIVFIVWLIRLEGKIKMIDRANIETQKDVDELRVKHEALDSKIIDQLSKIRESLARLEGKLGVDNK